MVLANENDPLLRGHAPGGRSGPKHCQECSERWPCDWAVLCDMYAEAEQVGRAAVRALAELTQRPLAESGAQFWCVLCMKGRQGDPIPSSHEEGCPIVVAHAVLATDTARRWLGEVNDG